MSQKSNQIDFRPEQVVILAGGQGTRLRPITDTIPKPMIQFHGKPFLEYLLEMLSEQGFKKVLLLVGYLPEVIMDYFEDGKKWGLEITYSISPVENDTGERLRIAKDQVDPVFLLMYCDNYWPMNFNEMWQAYTLANVSAMVTVYRNADNYSKSNIRLNQSGLIEVYDKSRQANNLQGVDIGFFVLQKHILDLLPEGNVNFEKAVMPLLVEKKQIVAFPTQHRYYSVGSHERLMLTESFLERKPTIVLDRDGVINKKAPKAQYVTKWSEWDWMPGGIEAIILLSKAGYRIIIVSNQAGINRGYMSHSDLNDIHKQMQDVLAESSVVIEKIYYCPHDWNENCECRKPQPGMLFQAQRDFHLDLSRIYFVGDDERDVMAGKAAGMKTILVNNEYSLLDFVKNYTLD